MGYTQLLSKHGNDLVFVDKQACVIAVRKADIPYELKKEAERFISRNVLPDCGRVPPNCLKAHLLNTASRLGLGKDSLIKLKNLFKSKIGFKGYYLDNGKLRRVEPIDYLI